MSIKRMVTKLALAFAAKKGMDAFRDMGGISGVKTALHGNNQSVAGTPTSPQGSSGGLGTLLGKLGVSGDALGSGSIGAVIGSLATAFGAQTGVRQDNDALNAEFNQTADVDDKDAGPVLRAMVQMARADGSIDADEQAALFEILDDATPQDKEILTAALREPVNAQGLADDTPAHARKEVYSAALLIGTPDTDSERGFLKELASGLRLDQRELDALHDAMGKPRMQLS